MLHSRRFGVAQHLVGVGEAIGERLLAEHMQARVKRRDRHLAMKIVGDGDHYSVEAAGGNHLAIVGKDPCAAELPGNLSSAIAIAATDRG